MANFCLQPILAAIFATIATAKVKLIPDVYTWAIFLINLCEENSEKQFLFFSLIGGQNNLLMHVAVRWKSVLMTEAGMTTNDITM